jgi:HEAT repeat protein
MSDENRGLGTALQTLLVEGKPLTAAMLQQFSDLDPDSLKQLLANWSSMSHKRKLELLGKLAALLDSNTLVSFEDLGRALLSDPEAGVRAGALRLLAESDDHHLIPDLIRILQSDPSVEPRLEAATLLGEFVLLGELEELAEAPRTDVVEALLAVEAGEEPSALRRRALEGLGYSSRLEVHTLIESASRRQDPEWVASALVAMGRSSDERWEEEVIGTLLSEDARIRLAAAEAAGELGLQSARPILLNMLEDEEDEAVTAAAVWSLSQIGGEDVRVYLQSMLDQTDDEEQVRFLEDAIDNLTFTEDLEKFDLMSYDPDTEAD